MLLVGASYLISATTVSCIIGQQVWLGEGCSLHAETLSFKLLGFSDSKKVKKQCIFVSLNLIQLCLYSKDVAEVAGTMFKSARAITI